MPNPDTFTVGLNQLHCSADPDDNVRRAVEKVRSAAKQGAQMVCLPELFRTQYFCQREDAALFDLAEPIPGPTTEALSAVARETKTTVVVSVFERRARGLYHNTAVILDADGSTKGLYRKMHIPDDPLYYEKFYFTPGDLGFKAFDTEYGRMGALVCWDQWYPEGARLTALQGANVLFYPTAIGWHPKEKARHGAAQASAWQTMQRAHAIAHGVYLCAGNRGGYQGPNGGQQLAGDPADGSGIEFFGGSFVCDPFGVVLKEAGRTEEEILVAEIDLGHQEDVRRNWPFLRDRRIDAYGAIGKRYLDE